jgi:hypothetical protein
LDGRIEQLLEQRRIKKLYRDALECAKDEGAKGSEMYKIARDYIAVLKINDFCVAPPESQSWTSQLAKR